MNRLRRAAQPIALTLSLIGLFVTLAWAAPAFPPLSGRVVDEAHVLSPSLQAELTAALADLEAKTSRQLVVVTLASLQGYDIADYGYQLGRTWGIGQKSLNNGVLFIIAPNERKVRIEVGYGLEGTITDALSSVILQERVLPKFRAGDIPGGIVGGTQALVQQLSLDPSTAEKIAAEAQRRKGQTDTDGGSFPTFLFAVLAFWIVIRTLSGRESGIGAALPWIILGGGRGRSSGGRGDEGGFSGGGGSFGGGGASRSW